MMMLLRLPVDLPSAGLHGSGSMVSGTSPVRSVVLKRTNLAIHPAGASKNTRKDPAAKPQHNDPPVPNKERHFVIVWLVLIPQSE
jgi:hypothetical protein